MKKILFSILAMAAMAACATDEPIALNQEAIQFGNAFVDNSVRATDPSYSNYDIQSFNVYGTVNGGNGDVLIYPGTLVEKNSAAYGAAWTCPVQQYWVAGAEYKFVAIVDGKESGVTDTTIVDGMPTEITYTADGETDLLCQTVTKTASTDPAVPNGLVSFDFLHLLSKVNFTVVNKSTTATGYSFVVKAINFAGSVKGVYDVVNNTWKAGSYTSGDTSVGNTRTVDSNEVTDIVVPTGTASTELETEVLFIPGTYNITFTVDILFNGNLVTSTDYPAAGTYAYTLEANKAYNFKVEVAVGELIQFTVAKKPTWENGNTNDSDEDDVNDYVPLA